MAREPYSSDVRNEEWAFVAPSLTLMTADAPQREYSLHEGLEWSALARASGCGMTSDAASFAALVYGVPTEPPLPQGWGI
jgi:hypothetical protein